MPILMKNYKPVLFLVITLGVGSLVLISADFTQNKKLRHVVAFNFKPEVTLEQMEKLSKDFHALKETVPQIIEFEGGADLNFQQEGKKFTHCFIVTVKNEKDLAAYGAHPTHQAFSDSAQPLLEEVMVVDYWAE